MTNTRLRSLVVAAACAAVAFVTIGSRTAEAGERRIATLAPAGSAWMNILEEGAEQIGKATGGRVAFKFYPGGTQGDEKDVVRKMKLGQLDGSALTTVGLSLIYPGIRVLQLPFLFESVEEVDYVRGKMWSYFQKKFQEKGFRLMYPGDVGWVHLYSNNALIDIGDLGKVKFWVWTDDPVVRVLFKKLNVSSVPLGVPEVLGALKTGRINGCYGPPLSTVALQWYTEVTHATEKPVAYTVGAMVIRNEAWDALSPEDQKAELKISKKIGKNLVKRVRKDNERAKKAMKKHGLKFSAASADMESKLRAEALAVYDALIGEVYSKAELEMVLKYREEFRAKQNK